MHYFWNNRSGNVAMMFGLLLIPMLVGAGVALDMLRTSDARSALSEAGDAGVLAAARAMITQNVLTQADAEVIARQYFDANGLDSDDLIIDSFSFVQAPDSSEFTLSITGRLKTVLLGVVGRDYVPINITSTAKVGPQSVLELALVLDNTRSMDGAKLDALKVAATSLVDGLMADVDNEVLVGIVPFSNYVNVGLSRRNESWIDVPDDYSTTEYQCRDTYPDRTESNCVTTTETCTSTRDGVTTSSSCERQSCDVDLGEPVEVCGNDTSNFVWRGCAGSREDPWDVRDASFTPDPVPGILNANCPQELTPLTLDKGLVTSRIASMSTQGDTYIATGLSWGLRLMSNPIPFSEGRTYSNISDNRGTKAMVLMTDGANTRSPRWPDGDHWGWDQALANARMLEACNEAKSNNIELYTIAFEVTDTTIKTLLEDCATTRDNYFDADDGIALQAAFNGIGARLQQLALSE